MSDEERERGTDGEGEDARTGAGTDSASDSGWRRRAVSALQWLVALGAFWYVARDVDWAATAAELAGIRPAVVLAIAAVTTMEFGTRFSMWYVLLNGRVGSRFSTAARIDLVIKFVNHVIPSKASGHSVAPLVVRHYTNADWSEAVAVSALNTGLLATLYAAVSLAGLGLFAPELGRGWLVVILLSTGVYLVAGTLVILTGRRLDLAGTLVGRLESLFGRVPVVGDRLAGLAGAIPSLSVDSAAAFRDLSTRPVVLVGYALGWAGTLMVAPGVRVWLLLSALGGSFSPAVLLPVVLVMAYSVTVLPLTPGGVGVAEASATAVFVALGVPAEIAAVVVLVDRTLGVYLPAMLGWIPMGRIDLSAVLARESG
jgi:uncharacterized protein (TIRG00374 family)